MLWTTGCPSLWTSRWNPVVAGARAGLANVWPAPRRHSSSGHLGDGDCVAVRGTGWSATALHTFSASTVAATSCTRSRAAPRWAAIRDRKSVVSGKSVYARVDLGGRRLIQKKKSLTYYQ